MADTTELVDPLEASRHPFETYLLALAAVSGLPLLVGQPNSGTINESLPPSVVATWGAMLVLGSSAALAGTYWRGRRSTGLLLERTGLVGVGGAAVIYALLAVANVGTQALFSACITAGFGFACFAQARRISARIRAVLHQIGTLDER